MSHVLSKEHLFVVAGDLAGKNSGKLENKHHEPMAD
jgi:hypothetical protein